jgi:hypothetical protein
MPTVRCFDREKLLAHLNTWAGRSRASTWESHHIDEARRFRDPLGSNHPEIARGTLRALIAKAGLTVGEFLAAAK